MGGPKEQAPSQPAPPSTAMSSADYNAMLENQYQQALKYAPLQAQQAVDLASQYALPYGEAYKAAQEAMYPGTVALQEQLASQAAEGMQSQAPQSVRDEYLSNMRSNLGTNVGSPIAADYTSRGLMNMNEDWKRYYQSLGLSVTGRQPLTQSTTPNTTDYMGQANLGNVMSFNSGIYGTQGSMYNSQMNAYSNNQRYNNPWSNMSSVGNLMSGAGAMGGLFGTGSAIGAGGAATAGLGSAMMPFTSAAMLA